MILLCQIKIVIILTLCLWTAGLISSLRKSNFDLEKSLNSFCSSKGMENNLSVILVTHYIIRYGIVPYLQLNNTARLKDQECHKLTKFINLSDGLYVNINVNVKHYVDFW